MEAGYLVASALIMEFIDSSLGMMFGTVLSPLLIIMNYSAKEVVPSILISQAIGGFIASWRHHRFKNADFNPGTTDRSIAVTVTWFGVFASLIGVFLSIRISPKALNSYIGILVLIIGLLILSGRTLIYSKRKIYLLGFVSAFNKALSGGGFGPLVAGGQLVLRDRSEKGAIGSTDLAEAPICLFSFFLWIFYRGLPAPSLWLPLCAGAAVGGFFGPRWLSSMESRESLKKTLGLLVLLEGVWVLCKAWCK
ncbi:MAG TPA: sulfite exporter TauE/SafE family protein [Geobacteraceae bacterium]